MPSDSETLGFVVLEAFASGVPVIGVRAGGLPDIIVHGETGYLTSNTDDMQDFSLRVKELIRDKALCARLGKAAREWAMGWSWKAATSKLRNVQYRQAIATHKKYKDKSFFNGIKRWLGFTSTTSATTTSSPLSDEIQVSNSASPSPDAVENCVGKM